MKEADFYVGIGYGDIAEAFGKVLSGILMNKIQITFATILLNLFLCGVSMAEEEKQSEHEKASPLNPAKNVHEPSDRNITIKVQDDGEQIIVDASFIVPVVPGEAWAVLTDFDNIPRFSPGVQFSKIIGKTGNNLHVSQKRVTKYGFFIFSDESVREVKLFPFEKIHERMISGSMRKMEETTQLSPAGNHTRVAYRALFIPGNWIPPVVRDVFIKQEAREQFQEIVNEIIRRKRMMLANQ